MMTISLEHTHIDENGHVYTHSHAEDHEHEHTHVDAKGNTYTHSHTHDHTHDHEHTHEHEHAHTEASNEEKIALLSYMLEHNSHHASELTELSVGASAEAEEILDEAVKQFNNANDLLAKYIAKVTEE